jgi:LysM repeat protein
MGLPVVILLFTLFLIFGGVISYFAFGGSSGTEIAGDVGTPTATLAPTLTPTPVTPTMTFTPQPTPTPLTYIVQIGDTCGAIGFTFNVSSRSIILLNGLDANCTNLKIGQELLIPHPTPTPTPIATSTLTDVEATRKACETSSYVVQPDENLSLIATIYEVSEENIMEWNGLTVSSVFAGQRLEIPLCLRGSVAGATVTPSPAPDYPQPELLLPLDGEFFSLSDEGVVLQWSSVGTLRENEAYQVTIIDVTDGETILVDIALDTRYIVPETIRPTGSNPHIFRWYVVPVAQIGTDEEGNPVWAPGGPVSDERVFSWSGAAE